MRITPRLTWPVVSALTLCLLAASGPLPADAQRDGAAAQAAPWTAVSASGMVEIRAAAEVLPAAWQRVRRGAHVPALAVVRTGKSGRTTLARGEDILLVTPGSELTLPPAGQAAPVVQTSGSVVYEIESRASRGFEVATPLMVAGVKGTVFMVTVSNRGTAVSVREGSVEVRHRFTGQKMAIEQGETALIDADEREVLHRVRREDLERGGRRDASRETRRAARAEARRLDRALSRRLEDQRTTHDRLEDRRRDDRPASHAADLRADDVGSHELERDDRGVLDDMTADGIESSRDDLLGDLVEKDLRHDRDDDVDADDDLDDDDRNDSLDDVDADDDLDVGDLDDDLDDVDADDDLDVGDLDDDLDDVDADDDLDPDDLDSAEDALRNKRD